MGRPLCKRAQDNTDADRKEQVPLTQGMPIILLDSLGDVVGKILSSHCRGGVKVPYKGATLNSSWKNKKIRISITSNPSMYDPKLQDIKWVETVVSGCQAHS